MNEKALLYLISAFLFVSLLGFVSAQGSVQFYPGELINITEVRCLEGGDTLCPDTTNCYITILNETEDFIYINQTMKVLENAFRSFDAGYAPDYPAQWSAIVDCDNSGVKKFIIKIGELDTVSPQSYVQFDPGVLINITEIRCLEEDDSLCSDTTNCYITIVNETEGFIHVNQTMKVLENAFRSFDAGYAPNYSTQWSAVVDCDNGGVEGFIIKIGKIEIDWETSFIIGLIGLISIYALTGFYIFSKEFWLIKAFMYFCAFGMLIVLINSAKILAVGSDSDKIITVGFTIAIVSLSIIFLYLFVFFFIGVIKSLKEKKGVRWRV